MSCTKEWNLKYKKDNKISLLDKLLEIRGITSEKAKEDFLNPYGITLLHPNAFCDMQKAVDRIQQAIDNGEKILIYGDFDADGVTATSVMLKTLKYLNADVDYYIPNRETEGHGLNSQSLVKILSQKKPKLIITVDNGISNIEEVKFINSFSRDVIITDHHEAANVLPEAYAIINPKALNSLDEKLTALQIDYLASLAGVGVAFKLAQGILERYNKIDFSLELLPYVAVGTIADLVPLIGENRYYVTKGLELIRQGKHYGLKRMLEAAGINPENGLTAEQVAFTIAPRINASGRLDTVESALKVLTSDNKQEIEMAIITLENYNKLRQELCSQTFEEADKIWQASGMRDNAIVLCSKDWHIGIIGIVASKFVEKYYKPTFIMNYSEENKLYRCSARGVNELNLYDIICNISDELDGFGGHKLAGGFSFSEEKTSFEAIKKKLNETVDAMLDGKPLNPSLDIDLELNLQDIDVSLVEEISKLEPFGMSNPSPTFVLKNLVLKQKKLMGATKEHLKLIIDTPNGARDCVWWSRGDIPLIAGDNMDIAFVPQLNVFNGNTDIQLIIKDIHSEGLKNENSVGLKIYDHRQKTNIYKQVDDYIKNSKIGISVFAEDRKIIDSLKPYDYITKSIVNRNTLSKNDAIMFFDYPADDEIYNNVKQTVSPRAIHYMNYVPVKNREDEYFKTLCGMIRYAENNLSGAVDISRAAARLGLNSECLLSMIETLKDSKIIELKDNNEQVCNCKLIQNYGFEKVTNTPKYSEFSELLNSVNEYKSGFMTKEF